MVSLQEKIQLLMLITSYSGRLRPQCLQKEIMSTAEAQLRSDCQNSLMEICLASRYWATLLMTASFSLQQPLLGLEAKGFSWASWLRKFIFRLEFKQSLIKATISIYLMESRQYFEEDLLEMPTPNRSAPSTPNHVTKKNAVHVPKSHFKMSPPSTKQSPKSPQESPTEPLEEKTLVSEEVRIKGQEKLTYLKQCKNKKLSPEQIFEKYPFCHMSIFTFDDASLRDQQGKFSATIIEDERGIHLIEEYRPSKKAKYVKTSEEENHFNGLSVSLLTSGNIFQGIYHHGKSCGLGYQLQPNGNTYIGAFKEGVKNGEGTFYWFSNSEVYMGDWQGGMPHGTGVYLGKDRYEGSFLNGLKFGFGEEVFSNGDKYVGQYVNSVADGYGEYFWIDQSVYKGDFKQGVRHGYGIWSDQHQTYKGYYRLDKKEGFGIYIWKNKQVYKGQFRDDFRDGYGEFYSLAKEQEKLKYKGCWAKGKKSSDVKPEEQVVRQLNAFLEKSDAFESEVEQNSQRKLEKKRVGHQNCIPKDSFHKGHH